MLIVEDTPRFGVQELKRLPAWSCFVSDGVARVALVLGGQETVCEIALTSDEAPLGTRWWLCCPGCRRRCVHLYLVDGEVTCRHCAGLVYLQQSWPASRWRKEVGIPLLREARRVRQAIQT